LSNDPDRLITALELDFDPGRELDTLKRQPPSSIQPSFLLASAESYSPFDSATASFNTVEVEVDRDASSKASSSQDPDDETCSGIRPTRQR